MTLNMDKSWYDFYSKRVNSSYQDYFLKKYKPLIHSIISQSPGSIREEGIGIGSVSKALKSYLPEAVFSGFDNSIEMLELSNRNLKGVHLYYDNILNPQNTYGESMVIEADMIVTHGVLEHFQDYQIAMILDRYARAGVNNIHYVPTNGYDSPSFGDERLLPAQHWLDTFMPKDHLLFNDNKDLLLINY